MPIDPQKAMRLLKVYRGVKFVGEVRDEVSKTSSFFSSTHSQVHGMMDFEDISKRVIREEVTGADVRKIGKVALKSTPRVYRFIARHIEESKREKKKAL